MRSIARSWPAHVRIEVDIYVQLVRTTMVPRSRFLAVFNDSSNHHLFDEMLAAMNETIVMIAAILVSACRTNWRMSKALADRRYRLLRR